MKQTRTKIPEGVTRVRNAVTGEVKVLERVVDKLVEDTYSTVIKPLNRPI